MTPQAEQGSPAFVNPVVFEPDGVDKSGLQRDGKGLLRSGPSDPGDAEKWHLLSSYIIKT
jgi:hypothetical protein